MANEAVRADLPADELRLLTWGSQQWGGPAYCTDAMAVAMGFADAARMLDDLQDMSARLESEHALTPGEWTRLLMSVEIVFASEVVGAAFDWVTVSGWTDEHTVGVLRRLQASLRQVRTQFS